MIATQDRNDADEPVLHEHLPRLFEVYFIHNRDF